MHFLFVRSKSPLSWFLRKWNQEDCSRVAVYVPEHGVFESRYTGIVLTPMDEFAKQNDICHSITFSVPPPVKHNTQMLIWRLSKLIEDKHIHPSLSQRLTGTFLFSVLRNQEPTNITPHQLYKLLLQGR